MLSLAPSLIRLAMLGVACLLPSIVFGQSGTARDLENSEIERLESEVRQLRLVVERLSQDASQRVTQQPLEQAVSNADPFRETGSGAPSPDDVVQSSGQQDVGNSLTHPTFQARQNRNEIGTNFFQSSDDFTAGLVIEGNDVAMKFGGYVKLDLIQDFNAIDNTDLFDVLTIPVGAPDRTNSRFHARQTRLNFDTRWRTNELGVVRAFIEGDFFSDGDQFRLRHAYGKVGRFLGGQTWTTFANLDAAPATLDFEGSISAITLRRTQVRWEAPIFNDDLNLAVALEDSETVIELPPGGAITGETRTVSPDMVARLRRVRPNGNLQVAGIIRELGFQPTGQSVVTATAWGLNFSQYQELTPNQKIYWQINYGDGIASLLGGLPDITPVGTDNAALLGYLGWMIGSTREWNERLSSNLTFAESHFQNTSGQLPTDVNNLTYLAVNTIWTPARRFSVGVEYLYGKREDIDGGSGIANRLQISMFYYLP